jgi:hypothetical protein
MAEDRADPYAAMVPLPFLVEKFASIAEKHF